MKKEHLNILITAQVAVGFATLSITLVNCVKEPRHISSTKDKYTQKENKIKYIYVNKNEVNKAILYAVNKVKDPYTWGGSYKWNKFDCSSLIQGAYAQIGIKLPRTAYTQYKYLKKEVDIKHLKEGDLIFYLTDKSRKLPVTHVAMYIGNNKIVEAKSRAKGIIISKFSTKNVVGIKRVI